MMLFVESLGAFLDVYGIGVAEQLVLTDRAKREPVFLRRHQLRN
jgi:hypothetical protein